MQLKKEAAAKSYALQQETNKLNNTLINLSMQSEISAREMQGLE